MEFQKTTLQDAWLIKPQVFKDHRGFFLESYSEKKFRENDIQVHFVQDNHSLSIKKGVLRGLHFQKPPYAQAKLVRVVKGAVFDVIVDLRKDSSTFKQWEGFTLSADNFLMLFIPQGFAHGFCTLEENTEFLYKCDNLYAPDYEGGIVWNDPDLKINWPIEQPILSDKDTQNPTLEEFLKKNPF